MLDPEPGRTAPSRGHHVMVRGWGWALDLFRGTQTREHADIEIAIPAANFPEIRDEIRDRFPGYAFDAVSSGRIWENATPDVLEETIPHMTRAQRLTLAELLTRVHPGHHWLANV